MPERSTRVSTQKRESELAETLFDMNSMQTSFTAVALRTFGSWQRHDLRHLLLTPVYFVAVGIRIASNEIVAQRTA